MADKVPVPVYFPRDLYNWLRERKRRGRGSLSQQAVDFCYEAYLRAQLAAAVEDVQTDPGALDRIKAAIEQGKKEGPPAPSPAGGP